MSQYKHNTTGKLNKFWSGLIITIGMLIILAFLVISDAVTKRLI